MVRLVYELCAPIKSQKAKGGILWKRIGAIYQTERGLSVKIYAIPTGGWDGWAKCFTPRELALQNNPPVGDDTVAITQQKQKDEWV